VIGEAEFFARPVMRQNQTKSNDRYRKPKPIPEQPLDRFLAGKE
jgi:hypothetical protein